MWYFDHSLPTPPPDEAEVVSINEAGTPSMCIAAAEWDFDSISKSSGFLDLSLEKLIDIIKRDELRVTSEHDVFKAVVRWLRKSDERFRYIRDVMLHVRFPLFTMEFLSRVVDAEPLMFAPISNHGSCRYLSENAKKYRRLGAKSRAAIRNNERDFGVRRRMSYAPPKVLYVFGQPPVGSRGRECVECYDIWTNTWSRMEGGIPVARAGVIVYQNRIWFVGGGNSASQACREVFSFNPREVSWRREKPLLCGRQELGVAVLNGKLYAVGGFNGVSVIETTEVYGYLGGDWSWHPCAPMKSKRSQLGIAVLGDRLYAIGGVNGRGRRIRNVEFYSEATMRWTTVRWLLTKMRLPCQTVVIDDLVYIVGGDSDETMKEFNPATERIRDQPYISRGINCVVTVAASDEKIYVAHGDPRGLSPAFLDCYDPATEIWRTIPRPHTSQICGTKAVVFDRASSWPYMESTAPNSSSLTLSCRYNINPLSPANSEHDERIDAGLRSHGLSYSDVLAMIPDHPVGRLRNNL